MISKGTSDTSRISRRALLAISYIVLISRYINATSLSAFFSPLATQWRISPTFNGAIFAAYPFGMALASFFAPRVIAAVGTRTVITGGLLLGSLLTVAFGVTPDVVSSSSPEQLGTLFMVTYFLNGLFGALAETACIILLTTRFQDRLGAVMAGVGSVCGIGCMVGPLVGGLMFDMTPAAWGAEWRFRMPFLITALFGVLLALSIHRWLPNQRLGVDGPSGGCVSSASLFLAVLSPSVILNLMAVALSGTAVATLDPTLPYRLSGPPFRFSATVISTFFLGSSFVYVLVSVPIGWLVDRFPGNGFLFKLTTGSGFLVLALSFALLAPLGVPGARRLADSFWSVVLGMGLKGLGSALSNNAVYPDLMVGFGSSDEAALATISAMWNAAYALGWALGPLTGGWLYDLLAVDLLCTGRDLATYCSGGGDPSTHANDTCKCEWTPDNGFDSFGTVVAFACAAFGAVCCLAALLRLSPGYRYKLDLGPQTPSPSARPYIGELPHVDHEGGAMHALSPLLPKARSVPITAPLESDEAIDDLLALLAHVHAAGTRRRPSGEEVVLRPEGISAWWHSPRNHHEPYSTSTRNHHEPYSSSTRSDAAQDGVSSGLSKAMSRRSHSRGSSLAGTKVDKALEHIGLGRFHLFTLPVLCFASMAQSLQTNVMSFLQPCAAKSFAVPSGQASRISLIVFSASAAATPCFGYLADAVGRKPATILSLALMVCANLGSISAPSFEWLCVWQGLAGLGLGGTMVPFDLLAELSPPGVRGSVLNASNWMWSIGSIVVALTAAWSVETMNAEGWRLLVAISSVPLVLTLLAAPILVESPHWLMHSGRQNSAVAVLRSIADANGVRLPEPRCSQSPGGYEPPAFPKGSRGTDGTKTSLASSAAASHTGDSCIGDSLASFPSASSLASVHSANSLESGSAGESSPTSKQTYAHSSRPTPAMPSPPSPLVTRAVAHVESCSLMSSHELRSRALLHWALWAIAGFGWTGLIFFATSVTSSVGQAPVLSTADDGLNPWLENGSCSFDYTAQILVVASEIPGLFLVQFVIDRPRGPFGLLGGRRGVQSLGYISCGLLTALMAQGALLGANGVIAVSCLSRMLLAAASSAMWVAAPEQYPTKYRGFGANTAFLFNVIGSVPAAALVYAPLPRWMVASGIGTAHVLAGCLALALPETAGMDLA